MIPACCFDTFVCPGYYCLFFNCRIRREGGGRNGWKAVLRRNTWGVLDYKNTLIYNVC